MLKMTVAPKPIISPALTQLIEEAITSDSKGLVSSLGDLIEDAFSHIAIGDVIGVGLDAEAWNAINVVRDYMADEATRIDCLNAKGNCDDVMMQESALRHPNEIDRETLSLCSFLVTVATSDWAGDKGLRAGALHLVKEIIQLSADFCRLSEADAERRVTGVLRRLLPAPPSNRLRNSLLSG